jgi:hypothetical protein
MSPIELRKSVMRANIKVKPSKGQSQLCCSRVTPGFCTLPQAPCPLPLALCISIIADIY